MTRAALGLGAIAVVIAGCGGSSGLSDKDYRAKADAICTSLKAQRDRLPPAQNITDLRAVARSTIAIETDALNRFRALKPPGDLKAPHAVILTRLGQTVALQGQALKQANPKSQASQAINISAGKAHAAIIAAAQQAKLPACEQL
jgi:hypothetical protein